MHGNESQRIGAEELLKEIRSAVQLKTISQNFKVLDMDRDLLTTGVSD